MIEAGHDSASNTGEKLAQIDGKVGGSSSGVPLERGCVVKLAN